MGTTMEPMRSRGICLPKRSEGKHVTGVGCATQLGKLELMDLQLIYPVGMPNSGPACDDEQKDERSHSRFSSSFPDMLAGC